MEMVEHGELTLVPIGFVAVGHSGVRTDERGEERECEIEIDAAWADALEGIDGFSHVWVIWWLDRSGGPPDYTRIRPEGRPEMPLRGIFATRSPHRPNPIAVTAVRLVEHRKNRLRVQGLDAYEGTPILDIKPYLRRGDLVAEATMPDWLERLWRIHDEERGQ
jgi:tRNA-Thr(GGU) m(6)t(6)A37 methyltransferase TsaA